jgi:diaminopimelate epimerase
MKFTKYHALGNDYIVVDPKDLDHEITMPEIKLLCDRHYGIGSDGVLYGPLESESSDFMLRIFNPDSSEAEKSGNGLRIFSRYLWDCGLVHGNMFSIETKGGEVNAIVNNSGSSVSVEMGIVTFTHDQDDFAKIKAEIISVSDRNFEFFRASVGNPHCVIPVKELSPELTKKYGKSIENDGAFIDRTNVQFMKVLDKNNIQIEIWERGAGYTLASGSSSTASAAVAYALGQCDSDITVHMPGGIIEIELGSDFSATMKGAVCKIGEGLVASESLKFF